MSKTLTQSHQNNCLRFFFKVEEGKVRNDLNYELYGECVKKYLS